jgi:hypothetical protein
MRIAHADGVWVRNLGKFAFSDQGVLMQPDELVCIRKSAWLEMQVGAGVFAWERSPLEPVKAPVRPKTTSV